MISRTPIPRLDDDSSAPFPDPRGCMHPEGLVAWGGDLARERLLNAYRAGIFPWFEPGGPILWWCPDPRVVLIPGGVHVSRRLARTLRQGRYTVSLDRAFGRVIRACAEPRDPGGGTWLTGPMIHAYVALHRAGHAHSLEVWMDGELAGGIYGVALGKVFFAESMFHQRRDASKIALKELSDRLSAWGFVLCDCQLWNPHLARMGAVMIEREEFLVLLAAGLGRPDVTGPWARRPI